MNKTHAVGIDLGTTYSCIAHLNEHGEPVTLANAEGEFSTPSAVLVDGVEIVVGTEAIRNAIVRPEHVILNAKRYIGEEGKVWPIDGRKFTPVDAEALILKKLIGDAQAQIGPIDEAVITVPAQFSDRQRHATIEAGHRAGLQKVDIINEPVAASLCHVLGAEGIWFSELADEQIILVYDLGGGTFDLSLVKYRKDQVSVLASSGDLVLGGNDWTDALMNAIAEQFKREFGVDPRADLGSKQALLIETEQAKRSLSVREKTALTVQHAGHRKSYQVEQKQFEIIAKPLVDRTVEITKKLLKEQKMGWAHINAVLITGGSSRMPMVRDSLQELSGRTLNKSLSPDQSIAHGATYYAGMLLSNNQFARSILSDSARARLARVRQQSVTARGLGILVRDMKTQQRVPHYLIPANTPLPFEIQHKFGTVVPNQTRVHLQVVESGTSTAQTPSRIGECIIDGLPKNLPEGSAIEVTIRYDAEAKVHVATKELASGKVATTEIIRQQGVVNQLEANAAPEEDIIDLELAPSDEVLLADDDDEPAGQGAPTMILPKRTPIPTTPPPVPGPKMVPPPVPTSRPAPSAVPPPVPKPQPKPAAKPSVKPVPAAGGNRTVQKIDRSDRPIPLCNRCGEPLSAKGECAKCGPVASVPTPKRTATKPTASSGKPGAQRPVTPGPKPVPPPQRPAGQKPAAKPFLDDDDILELDDASSQRPKKPLPPPPKPQSSSGARKPGPKKSPEEMGEDEFWSLLEE